MTKADVGQLLSDQMTEFLGTRKAVMIEPDFMDDEDADLRLGLNRWQDREYTKAPGFGPMQRHYW